MTFDDLLAAAVPPQRTIRLCLRGDITDALQVATDDLTALTLRSDNSSIGGDPAVAAARTVVADLTEQAAAATVPFTLQGINGPAWDALVVKNPPRDNEAGDRALGYNPLTLFDELVGACLIKPECTPEQVTALRAALSAGQWDQLCDAALTVARRHTRA